MKKIVLLLISVFAIQMSARAYDGGHWWLYALFVVMFAVAMVCRDVVVGQEAIKEAGCVQIPK